MSERDEHDVPGDITSDLPPELVQALNRDVADALRAWQHQSGASVAFDRWLTPGTSSALVAAIAVSGFGNTRRVIMKVCPPGQLTGREPARSAAAFTDAPDHFASRHLVAQTMEPLKAKGGWGIMFQELAGGSMRSVRALSTQRGRNLPALAASIVRSILDDWNHSPVVRSVGSAEFLREHVGTRLAENGPLDALASELTYSGDVGEPPKWVRTVRGNVVPNAVAWIREESWSGLEPEHILVIRGRAHGDLHPDNILLALVPRPDADSYRLIDLSWYSPDAPLIRDAVHLMLSCIVHEVTEMTELQRQAVADFLIDPTMDAAEHLQVAGVCDLANDIDEAGEKFARGLSMVDDWQDMRTLSLAGNSLIFAMRPQDLAIRQWCYELGCAALGKFLASRALPAPTGDFPVVRLGAEQAETVGTPEAVETLYEACERWTGRCTNIAVVDSAALDADACDRFARMSWDVVVEMNSRTDVDGCWASASSDTSRVQRLRLPGQDLIFGRNSTLWIAAAGLSDVEPIDPAMELRSWRVKYLRFVSEAFVALARHTAKPVTLTCLGFPHAAHRAVVEAGLDVFGDRARLVVVSEAGEGDLAEYGAELIMTDPGTLLHAILPARVDERQARQPTLPSAAGPIPLSEDLVSRFGDTAQLLHSEIGTQDDTADDDSGAFYRGRPISWFELDLYLDVPRGVTDELLGQVKDALEQRDTLRILVGHAPGAGAMPLSLV
jgi:hypothetical protein